MLKTTRYGFTITVDIHGLYVADARRELERLISSAPKDIKEIEVIHGYTSGQALQKLVRQQLRHRRIVRRIIGLNQGSTTLVIAP